MADKIITKVLIIGSGPAGYTAAIYAARANLQPHLVSGLEPGGQLSITTDVENYPGFGDVIQGPWLMEQMKKQAEKVGTVIHNDLITKVDIKSRPFISISDSGIIFESATIIISTGAQARWLNIESEKKYTGYGISACATCDGFFFKDKEVAVIGGGNTAVEEALFLTNFASKITLIHRRDSLRAEKILQGRLFKNSKINILWNKKVKEFIGIENPNSLEKIIHSAKQSQAHEFIEKLPNKYDTLIGERGQKLSVGQKQRIAIARAIYKDPPILVFDEATSSVDNETELLLQKALNQISKNRTTVVIAHRLSTVRNADYIIVLGNNNIIEDGNHTSLLEKNGTYKKLWDIQTGKILLN